MNCPSPRGCSAVCRTCPDGLSVTGVSPPTPFASASGTWAHDPPSRPGVPTRPSPARSGSTSTATWLRTSGHGSRNGAPSRHATKKPRVLFSAFSVSPLLPIGSCNQALTGLSMSQTEIDDSTAQAETFLAEIAAADTLDALEQIRVRLLGRNGAITASMRGLGKLPPEERRDAGARLNALRNRIAAALTDAADRLQRAALANQLKGKRADVTLPVSPGLPGGVEPGRIHPISQTIDEIVAIFGEMGFVVAEGPHIEEDFYNFTALNIPPEHPARQEHDTFYLPPRPNGSRLVLRTHTSPVQIRTMLAQKPPLRIIVPGRTFRMDHDATHSPMFHQVEGLVIERTTHMGHLKGCLIEFCRAFFG